MDFNFHKLRGNKVLTDLQIYIDSLISSNEMLKKKLENFNKDEEIQRLNEELKDIRVNSIHIMSEKENEDAKAFRGEHYNSCESNIQYILEGTGIGTAISVRCKKCNVVKSITDVSNW